MVGAMRNPSPRKLAKHGHLLCESVEAAPMTSHERLMARRMCRDGVFIDPFVETNGDKRRKLISQRPEAGAPRLEAEEHALKAREERDEERRQRRRRAEQVCLCA